MQALTSECHRLLSLQHSNIDFTLINKISIRDLGDLVKKEHSINISSKESQSFNHIDGASLTTETLSIHSAELMNVRNEIGDPSFSTLET